MWQQTVMAVIGFAGGVVAAGGIVALLIGLGITPRYAAVTHTADKILFYEDVTMLGAVAGNLVQLYEIPLPFGNVGLALFGLGSGIFLGGWILALAEMLDVFPIVFRRLKIREGGPFLICVIAVAKVAGSLFYFLFGMDMK